MENKSLTSEQGKQLKILTIAYHNTTMNKKNTQQFYDCGITSTMMLEHFDDCLILYGDNDNNNRNHVTNYVALFIIVFLFHIDYALDMYRTLPRVWVPST